MDIEMVVWRVWAAFGLKYFKFKGFSFTAMTLTVMKNLQLHSL